MPDKSLYENDHPNRLEQAFGIAFGRITRVFPEERMCEVKTFYGSGSMDDQHIPKCQWINLDANPDGDEQSIIPREQSTGLVFWVDGEPFIFGYFRALDGSGRALTGSEVTRLTAGDKLISTVGGNRIVVKSSGAVEIISRETLKTVYFPPESLLQDLVANYEMRADGGSITWRNINLLNETLHKAEYRRDMLRTSIIVEEKGRVDATTVKRTRIGPGIPGVEGVPIPLYESTVGITGATKFALIPQLPAFETSVQPTGAFKVQVGPLPQFLFDVAPTGATKMEINNLASLEFSPLGDITLKNAIVTIEAKAAGDFKFTNNVCTITGGIGGELELEGTLGKMKLGRGTAAIGGPAGELFDIVEQVMDIIDDTIDAIMQITVPTAVGPSGPPLNAPAFVMIKVSLTLLKTTLGLVKGSL